MQRPSILIVEDEAIVALDLKFQLQDLGYTVVGIADSAAQALEAVGAHAPQLILMDVRLQGPLDGIAAAQLIRERHDVPLIFLTSHSDDDTVQRAARAAPYGYLTKPYQIRELRAGIEVALTKARMERQLREADRWFAHTLQCVADGVVVTDLQAQVRFLNPAAEQLTGWSLEQALGQPVGDIVRRRPGASAAATPDDATRRVTQAMQDGRPQAVLHGVPLLSRTGQDRYVDESAGPVDDDGGRRLGAVLVLRDAAPRLAQEALLRASEARFRSTFDFAPLGMALVAQTGEFIQVNDALCALLGLSREDLGQRSHLELTLEPDREHEAQRLHELALAPGGVVQFEKRYHRADGEPLWTLVSVSLLQDEGQAGCYLYQVHDLSEQKQAAEHLAALAEERMRRQASELANESKNEFLSRVSHEMRTPLNAVMGFAQLLQMQQPTPDAQSVGKYADHIHAAAQHLLGLVTDLLDLNSAGQGSFKLQAVPVALAGVLDDTLRLIQGQAQARGVGFDVSVPEGLCVLADAQRLRQVLVNIGTNAIKYNRAGGGVRIRAERSPDAGVLLTIDDDGPGMSAEQLQRLFQPFERLGAERTAVPGIGLGLVIARSLMLAMGGAVDIDSTPPSGTRVTLRLRAA